MAKTVIRYWIKIICRAWEAAEKGIGVKGLFIDLAIALVALLIYWLNHGRPPLQELDEGAMIAISIFVGLIIITMAVYIFREPSVLNTQ